MAGFLTDKRCPDRRALVQRMAERVQHRGPDGEGVYVDHSIALGARRLSIVDPRTGAQPISNEDGTVWALLNGEIYNHGEFRDSLQSLDHRFRSRCDTEVLVHAWEEYREKCVLRLDGMFACAIWDTTARTLFLARDRMGEKPLYYATPPEAFVFGSEVRVLLEHPAVHRELSFEGLAAYFAFEYVPDPLSIMAGILKLPPGHLLTVRPGGRPQVTRYWDIDFATDDSVSESEWCAEIRQQLETSIRRRLIADVPVGFFRSGGLDSSAVVALAAGISGGRGLRTFSIGFRESSHDERGFARAVARHYGTDHHETTFTADDTRILLEGIGDLLDEPLVDGSFLPTYALSQFARQSVTVALSGDGGDELFCGYPTFVVERWLPSLANAPRWLIEAARVAVDRLTPSTKYWSIEFLLKQLVRGLPHTAPLRTQLLLGGLTSCERSELFSPWVAAKCMQHDPYDILPQALTSTGALDPIPRGIYQHCKFYLAGQNLVNVDRASMAAGLEVRAPFLDHAVVGLAGRIPSALKLRGWRTKYILKEALRGLLPPAILARRKQGFGVPIGLWLRGPLRTILEDQLCPDRVRPVGLFDSSVISRLVTEHISGRRDHRKVLWALLVFEAWRERYLPRSLWT